VLTSYKSQRDFMDAVSVHMTENEVPHNMRAAILEGITAASEAVGGEISGNEDAALNLKVGRWFIRDDDLPFFESVGVIGTVLGSLMTTGVLAAPAAIASATTLAAICWRIWRKGGRLNRDQMRVLTVLKSDGPLTEGEVRDHLARTGLSLTLAEVHELLFQLTDVQLYDGTLASLVRPDANKNWRAVGV
jgi:hypothetical protein